MQSYYQTLGVRTSATDAEIRAAYIRLIKRHHPDIEHNPANKASRDINCAYAVLKHSSKRAVHDQELEAWRKRCMPFPPPGRSAAFPSQPKPRRNRPMGIMAVLAALLATLAVAPKMGNALEPVRPVVGPVSADEVSPDELLARQPPIYTDDILAAADDWRFLRMNGTAADVVKHSHYCFEQLKHELNLGLFDQCVAFDRIAQPSLARSGRKIDHFTEQQIQLREARAASALFADDRAAAARLQRLSEMATTFAPPGSL